MRYKNKQPLVRFFNKLDKTQFFQIISLLLLSIGALASGKMALFSDALNPSPMTCILGGGGNSLVKLIFSDSFLCA
jgi:uncharacterized membrane protein YuzA (DUF378 family)